MGFASNPSDVAQAERGTLLAEAIFGTSGAVAIMVLLPLYEYLITLDQEVATVWQRGRRLTFASALLVSTRWYMIIQSLVNAMPACEATCERLVLWFECLGFIGYALVVAFGALRISAIWGRNHTLFLVLFIIGMAPLPIDAYTISFQVFISRPGIPCIIANELPVQILHKLMIVKRVLLIFDGALILFLTSMKTYRQIIDGRRAGIPTSVSTCLLRDGALYFVILLAFNIAIVLPRRPTEGTALLSAAMQALPQILANRFMLNLRQSNSSGVVETPEGPSRVSAPRFRATDSFFGNFGEPLDHGVSGSNYEEVDGYYARMPDEYALTVLDRSGREI